jgi:hypothetical protein
LGAVALSPPLDRTHRLLSRGGVTLLVRRDWEAALPVDAMLEDAPLAAWGASVSHRLSGRGPLHVLATARGEIVVKQLVRGGLAGGLLRGSFFDARRPLREAEAAELLSERGIRTPPVVAARITRGATGLRLESATERVSGADLLEACRDARSPATLAAAVGRTLREAHAAGLRHRDLQVKNLLVPASFPGPGGAGDPEPLVVLDLDRCSVGEPLTEAERQAALARLGRSLVKQGILPGRAASGNARPSRALWALRSFLGAYGVPPRARAAFLAALAERVTRQLRLRRALWAREAPG